MRDVIKKLATLGVLGLLYQSNVFAIPLLQLYIDGGSYDAATETWVISQSSFDLWVIGNINGAGGKGTLQGLADSDPATAAGVTLVATVLGGNATLSFTPTTASVTGITDSGTPGAVVTGGRADVGAHPDLGPHGIFTGSNAWQEYDLGIFDQTGDSLWDAMDVSAQDAVISGLGSGGQINVYQVTINGVFDAVHFDGFGYYAGKKGEKFTFVPFSHDAEATSTQVPEPMGLVLLGAGLLGLGFRKMLV